MLSTETHLRTAVLDPALKGEPRKAECIPEGWEGVVLHQELRGRRPRQGALSLCLGQLRGYRETTEAP